MSVEEAVLELKPFADTNLVRNTNIERKDGSQLSYNDFYWTYLSANWPVILTGVSTNWECRRNWTQHSSTNGNIAPTDNQRTYTAINYDYLRRKIGNCRVPVANCNTKYYNSHAKREMYFHDFLEYWQTKAEGDSGQKATENSNTATDTTENLYLKDWHLKAEQPDYEFYQVPKYFASDWLNEHLVTKGSDDYRFVYMGPKGSWTPFHADVFGSYSWSTNIAGCKSWLLLPPGEELKLKDRLGNLPFRIDEHLLEENHVRYFNLRQEENEAIFVPSGWYHQVWNLTDTISVNHNWFNACNLERIWLNLSGSMQQVIAEIEDCRQMDNFDEHCQTMLRASFGTNYLDFLQLLEFIINRRLDRCINANNNTRVTRSAAITSSSLSPFDIFMLNDFHVLYDLQRIRAVLELMLQDPVICDSRTVLYRKCIQLMELTSKSV